MTVSSIVRQNAQWGKNLSKVNKVLLSLCKDENISFINHSAIDASFSTMQFNIEGYYTSGLDRNEYGGDILLIRGR